MPAANYKDNDTIVARVTPAGRGGVAIIRISGPDVCSLAKQLLKTSPEPRTAIYARFFDAADEIIDTGIALYFPGPASFTGEDVLEFQGHGGALLVEMILERALELGARLAEPGEFSRRAFLNDKIDLSQAEAIADLIDSGSRAAARAAQRSLQGNFSSAILSLNHKLTELRMFVEAAIDFPEEEIDFLSDSKLKARLDDVAATFVALEKTVKQGRLLRDGIHVVLAGRPNAGKSSLLNALAGYDAAIVTDIPGTTRDIVREHIDLDGLPLHVIDTAGLRDTTGKVELEGIKRARAQIEKADHALLIVDASDENPRLVATLREEIPEGIGYTVVRNKIDLIGGQSGLDAELPDVINISAKQGLGLDELRKHLKSAVGYEFDGHESITARQRHVDSLNRARLHFDEGSRQLTEFSAGELMAEELLQAQNALAEITGQFTSDDLLGEIFSRFCIGK
ncbi:MAG: tRNA uridine-5-carboxymethylaminomethyl(34) synthesis GTPase MnmE [Gammaproteobacteria bacterium]|nr:tRNA uridine-5-carboxymethylaminomethyl(34) synthesis GTPase MnmE [Gammaproteobacteria bacterium]